MCDLAVVAGCSARRLTRRSASTASGGQRRNAPATASKWNKIEHRMFSRITQNWRGRPLVSHEVIIKLIANTTTRAGLKIRAQVDKAHYPTGIKVSNTEFNAVNLKAAEFHGDWNYAILPSKN